MKIVIVNGAPTVGKDSFVSCCNKHTVWCGNFSTVDFVKELAAQCGWNGTKTLENRKFLSDLKDLLTEWGDVPFKKVKEQIEAFAGNMRVYGFSPENEGIVFVHCREPKEIAKFVEQLGATTLLIRREAAENSEKSNHADTDVFNYKYDYVIENNGTFEELEQKAKWFLQEMNCRIL